MLIEGHVYKLVEMLGDEDGHTICLSKGDHTKLYGSYINMENFDSNLMIESEKEKLKSADNPNVYVNNVRIIHKYDDVYEFNVDGLSCDFFVNSGDIGLDTLTCGSGINEYFRPIQFRLIDISQSYNTYKCLRLIIIIIIFVVLFVYLRTKYKK